MSANDSRSSYDRLAKLFSPQTSVQVESASRPSFRSLIRGLESTVLSMQSDTSDLRNSAKEAKKHVQLLRSELMDITVNKRTQQLQSRIHQFNQKIRSRIERQAARSRKLVQSCYATQQSQRSLELGLMGMRKRIQRMERELGL